MPKLDIPRGSQNMTLENYIETKNEIVPSKKANLVYGVCFHLIHLPKCWLGKNEPVWN